MPSHGNDGERVVARVAGDHVHVVVAGDPRSATHAQIDDVLSACALTARLTVPARTEGAHDGRCGLALVVVAERPSSNAPVLDQVRRLKDSGYTVMCCAHDAGAWPVGVRCRLLLAGAADVLDSRAQDFATALGQWLTAQVTAAHAREHEERQLVQQMRGHGLIGRSPAALALFRWIVNASALSDLPVLIAGETGTGKELAARAIHRLDPRRRDRPFVPVNCGAIAAGLAESELFGHRRGAFTGAEQDRLGLIRAARGGVLFLDEIGDLESSLQAKLLRVLQERRVLAVGDDHEVPVDVRVIAATNRDLEDMVARRAFRADLFHRLDVLSFRMPTLRERPEDIEPIVLHVLAQCAQQVPHLAVTTSREFLDALWRLALPGNVRQLENVVRRAVVTLRRGERLGLNHLPPESWLELSRAEGGPLAERGPTASNVLTLGASAGQSDPPLDPVALLDAASWKLEGALALCEQRFVAAALGASRGNRARAARLLGISPRCIFNKMRKHRLTA